MRRERITWRSLSNFFSQSLGNHWEENAERIKESEVIRGNGGHQKYADPLKQLIKVHMNLQRWKEQQAQGLCGSATDYMYVYILT